MLVTQMFLHPKFIWTLGFLNKVFGTQNCFWTQNGKEQKFFLDQKYSLIQNLLDSKFFRSHIFFYQNYLNPECLDPNFFDPNIFFTQIFGSNFILTKNFSTQNFLDKFFFFTKNLLKQKFWGHKIF